MVGEEAVAKAGVEVAVVVAVVVAAAAESVRTPSAGVVQVMHPALPPAAMHAVVEGRHDQGSVL